MNTILKSSNVTAVKRMCPYAEKCYRKNPVHFNEMSHPHLEKLIVNQLDKAITLPDRLDFECRDRSQLLDQLKVLQMVLKRDISKNEQTDDKPLHKEATPTKKTPVKNKSEETKGLEDLKEKIEKHRLAALEKREAKLKALDSKAAVKDDNSRLSTENLNRKRLSPDSSDEKSPMKKTKDDNDEENQSIYSESSYLGPSSQSTSSQQSLSQGSASSSYIENFTSSSDRVKKEKIRDEAIARMRQAGHKVVLATPGEFALKFALSAPYHYFMNRVENVIITHSQEFTVSFPELLDISLGEIVNSLHINFMVEIGWLCLQYLFAAQNAKMLIFCGSVCDPQVSLPANINLYEIKMPTAWGCHHTKVSVLHYKDDGIRVIVSTANLYCDDWDNRTQGIWMSPHLPKLPDNANPSDGDSPTGFKKSFTEYLAAYNHPKLLEWERLIRRADFSSVNVFFVGSVPGSHKGLKLNSWGHRRLASILTEHAVLPPDAPQWPIIAQCSSIGMLGPNYESWLLSNIVSTMSKEKNKGIKSNPNFQFVYPSLKNYEESFDCRNGSCCLPYSRKSHEKQQWLTQLLYQWKADSIGRTKAMPHFKCYTRVSPDQTEIPWFVLTSANLSKGAWGTTAKNAVSHYIMNYEAGVVFIPKFVTNGTTFPLKNPSSPDVPVFRLPYDLPLTRYQLSDVPFVCDYLSDN